MLVKNNRFESFPTTFKSNHEMPISIHEFLTTSCFLATCLVSQSIPKSELDIEKQTSTIFKASSECCSKIQNKG